MNNLKDFFHFSHTERRGIVSLLIILFLLIISPLFFKYFKDQKPTDFSAFDKEIIAFENSKVPQNDTIQSNQTFLHQQKNKITPFEFDPNNLPDEKWKALGLNDKQIKVIKNYEAKGGKFYKKEYLKKIYSIKSEEYSLLEPYIRIADNDKKNFKKFENKVELIPVIEINSADSMELLKIKGISPWLAKGIIKYRNLLGGFANKEQLLEVYNLDSVKYFRIEKSITVNKSLIKKINLNSATFRQLNNHPYIKYEIASLIVNYRQKHGNFKTLDELKTLGKTVNDHYEKLTPYFFLN